VATPEWRKLMEEGAFNQTRLTGAAFEKWLDGEDQRHRALMSAAGFMAKK